GYMSTSKASQPYRPTVNPYTTLSRTPATLSNATANSAYSATLSATGGSGTYTFAVTTGSLPSWLALNTSTGVLSGTPTTTGTSNFTITATDGNTSTLKRTPASTLSLH